MVLEWLSEKEKNQISSSLYTLKIIFKCTKELNMKGQTIYSFRRKFLDIS